MLLARIGSPALLGRDAAQMHDGVDPGNHGVDSGGVGEVGRHDLLACAGLAHRLEVAQPQRFAIALQARAQLPAELAGSAGQQQTIPAQAGGGGVLISMWCAQSREARDLQIAPGRHSATSHGV